MKLIYHSSSTVAAPACVPQWVISPSQSWLSVSWRWRRIESSARGRFRRVYQPLWKMMEWKSVGIMKFPIMMGKIINVPKHQPDDIHPFIHSGDVRVPWSFLFNLVGDVEIWWNMLLWQDYCDKSPLSRSPPASHRRWAAWAAVTLWADKTWALLEG